uniref:Uncharacterized protein n=1 Tax=Arundo donax TaxID=35708 RepID=A0A0A9B2N1_ARUDO
MQSSRRAAPSGSCPAPPCRSWRGAGSGACCSSWSWPASSSSCRPAGWPTG